MKNEIRKERTHLFAPSINIAIMICFSEKIPYTELTDSIHAAVKNNEVLNCNITLDEDGKAFYETVEKEDIVLQMFRGRWEDIVIEQEKIPFDLLHGELLRFFLKEEDNTTQLVIIAHHLVGDGLAITYFAQDIIKKLNGTNLQYKKQQLFNMNNVPKDSKLNLFMRFMLGSVNKKWNKTGKIFSVSEYESMYKKYWISHKSRIQTAIIKEEQLVYIEKEAKLHNVTINSIFVTALAKAAGDEIEIGIPVSLREKANQSMANHSTAISIKYRYDDNKNFWENASLIHKSIYQMLSNNKKKFFLTRFMDSISPTLIDAAYFAAFDGYSNKVANSISNMFGYSQESKTINLSNLTKIEFEQNNAKYHVDNFIFVPPIVPNASYMIGVVTSNKKMVVTLHAMDDEKYSKKSEVFECAISILSKLGKQII